MNRIGAFTASSRDLRIHFCVAALSLLFAIATPARAIHTHDCPQAGGDKTVKEIHGFLIEFTATNNDDFSFGQACRVAVRDSAGNTIFSQEDFDFSLVMSDADVNGDGVQDLVLESFSGGAHCCWTYYIISLGEKPRLIKQFQNDRGAAFIRNEQNGCVDIVTQDAAFDSFDDQCHACAALPVVYLRLDGEQFVDVGAEHIADYDEIIAKNQQALSAVRRRNFRSAQADPYQGDDGTDTTAQKILSIIFAYLYSGREAQSRRALQDLWPPFDQERLWKLVLQTRQEGILGETRKQGQ